MDNKIATSIKYRTFGLHTQNKVQQGYDTTNEPTTNECYKEQFLSIKSGCYNEREGILFYGFIMKSSIILFTRERLFMPFEFIRTGY